jgi:DNA helicase-2/ATP-dependent DNA helicase PcrA
VPDADALLEMLDPEQREVATALRGPVCVLAGAGTGKTRAITARIAYGVHSGVLVPQRVLAVTFTARAAGEMRTRLRALGAAGVQARTFHAAALRQLRYFWPRHVGGELPPLVEHKAGLVAEAAGRLRLATDRATVRDLAAEIEWTRVTMTDRDDYPAAVAKAGRAAPAGLDPATVVRLLATYDQVKRDRHVIDFEDVLLYTVGLIDEHRQVADAVRGQYQHLVVDEYQDVSPLQQALLDQWLGGRDEVCVVGDPHQTIYTFAGASPDFLLGFRERYPSAREVRLVRDYRSTPQVVALANRLVGAAPTGPRGRLELVAQRPPGPAPELREHPDEPAEARWVATRIATLLAAGTPASEMAVLFRTNGQSETYEQALADAGVPYLLRGAERFFDRPEVREARLLLRGAARSADGGDVPATVRAVLSAAGWSETPPEGAGAVRDRWESLAALARLAEDFAATRRDATRPDATLRDFVAELDERAEAQHAPTVEGVTLASLHAAKGLEWDAVFVVGASEGMLPITYAQTAEQVEEERRLLYVGVTRAREHLAISWSLARSPGGRASRRPSRFLDGLHTSSRPAPTPGGSRAARRRGPASCRVCGAALTAPLARKLGRCEDCPASYDEELFERLRAWRAERAREQDVPAYVVFTDATLTALAEVRPGTEAELLAVSGVGRAKLDRYGADVLALVADAAAASGANRDDTDDFMSGVKKMIAPDAEPL